jgi:hypothetical protein
LYDKVKGELKDLKEVLNLVFQYWIKTIIFIS